MNAVERRARGALRRFPALYAFVRSSALAVRPSRLSERDRERTQRHPLLADFVRTVDAALRRPLPGGHERCRPAFERLLHSDILRDFVNAELETLRCDPQCGKSATRPQSIAIVETERFRLAVEFVSPLSDAHAVWSISRTAYVGACTRVALSVERAVVPPRARDDVFDPNAALRDRETIRLERGEALLLRRGRHAARFGAATPTVMLLFQTGPAAAFASRYDPRTLLPNRVHPVRLEWSRLHASLRFIAATNDASLFRRVRALYAHPSYHVRWAALRTALAIAPKRAKRLVRRAARDPHPQVGDAARELLRNWDHDSSVRERALAGWR